MHARRLLEALKRPADQRKKKKQDAKLMEMTLDSSSTTHCVNYTVILSNGLSGELLFSIYLAIAQRP